MGLKIPQEVINEIREKGRMTVPLEHKGVDFGLVTVEADDVGMKVIDISSNDAAMRKLIIGMYVVKF